MLMNHTTCMIVSKEQEKGTDRVVGCGTDNVNWLSWLRMRESIECSKKQLRGTRPYNNVTSFSYCIPDHSVQPHYLGCKLWFKKPAYVGHIRKIAHGLPSFDCYTCLVTTLSPKSLIHCRIATAFYSSQLITIHF